MPDNLTINARNFRGLVSADIECAPIALIAGHNYSAKTSLLQGVAAALTGKATEAFDLPKKDAALLVHDGAEKAQVRITAGDGSVQLEWPECRLMVPPGGDPPRASVYAAGLHSIATIPVKERALALEPYIKATPTAADLADHFRDVFIDGLPALSATNISRLWQRIERDGWDALLKEQTTERQKTAGAWEHITGARFGSQKIKDWQPKGWRPSLDQTEDEELERRVKAADQALEEAIRNQAVDAAEITRLEALAAQEPTLRQAHDAAATALRQASEALNSALQDWTALPYLPTGAGLPCPWEECGRPLQIKRDLAETTIEKYRAAPEGKLKQMREHAAGVEGNFSRRQAEKTAATKTFQDADRVLEDAIRAAEALQMARDKTAPGTSVETARLHQANARTDLEMSRKYTEALEHAARWELLQLVIAALAPTGLRQKKLGEAIAAYNSGILAPLSKLASFTDGNGVVWQWKPVEISEDIGITYGDRPYALLSESEQFRARIILQIAMAQQDGSTMLVIDRADILDNDGRNQLFALLAKVKIPTLIAITWIARPDLAPDLEWRRLGTTYWLADGVTQPLTTVLHEAA